MNEKERLALVCGYSGDGLVIDPNKPNRAGCVVFNRGGEVLLVKGLGKDSTCWIFPKGHIEMKDPTPADAAIREVREETGVEVDYTTIPFLCYTTYDYKGEGVRVAWFSAQAVVLSEVGDHDIMWCSLAKAREVISIPDLLRVMDIALCRERVEKE